MYLCIDIGGTKTLIALVDKDGKILHSVRFATVADQNIFYASLLQQIRVNFVLSGIKAASIAMPGIIKRNQAVWLGNLPWQNFDLAAQLKQDLCRDFPIYVENDANLGALGEAKNSPDKVIYFTFSTGIGGGVVTDGKIIPKYQDFEPGHKLCTYHGEKAEWEDFAAASAINNRYSKRVTEISDRAAWEDIVDRILLGLAPYVAEIKPDTVVFGGPLGLQLPRYRRQLKRKLAELLPKNVYLPRLVKARNGAFSVIKGCYLYAKSRQKP
jgi:predicted NBD/HSP70 family sugar kinase